MKRLICIWGILFFVLACGDNAFYEQNQMIKNRAWTYTDKIDFPVHITDNRSPYAVFINLRHGSDYDFSNIYVLLHQKGPQLTDTAYRKEIMLAQLDGRWLGKSAGSLYEIQHLAHPNFLFPDTGIYTFSLEQNMRQNPLIDISDVGIKLVKK
ncbi:gliding motility lipoprotein GldH [Sphingobacterium sp. SGG-5]|uniref:gliding motility lipoprotein GldH n=1 Tax=Sphingobacterium sp. SGG-5 TaxID=2710881 RepID=UPI0013ED0595|nr:gliding motility lipoprotein GldH [Sphingobacterium sp. SGG-5]NGM61078.1 gliding motility lipoprotein GldH [Sphingobacterium sp. SGG-5]